ncbi:MAG: orotidine-5'-phosphate decarboxylase [Armatimonadota bacterium]
MARKDKIIVALDVSTESEAVDLVHDLKEYVGAFKIGMELFNSAGPRIIEKVQDAGADRIFYDGKFHDIPNTVAGAARAAVRMGVWMFNIHAEGGAAMMCAASDAAHEESDRQGVEPPIIIAVTLLTSIGQDTLLNELAVHMPLSEYVPHLARLAQDSGLDGVVASPHEISAIKAACGKDFLVVTPGVRPSWASANDQKRIMTPGDAVRNGADYLVIGRAITSADDKIVAAKRIIDELESVSS